MQTDFPAITEETPKRVLWKLATCEDYFDRDHDTLVVDVENQSLKFAWDIAAPGALQKEISVWGTAAPALQRNQPLPLVTEVMLLANMAAICELLKDTLVAAVTAGAASRQPQSTMR